MNLKSCTFAAEKKRLIKKAIKENEEKLFLDDFNHPYF